MKITYWLSTKSTVLTALACTLAFTGCGKDGDNKSDAQNTSGVIARVPTPELCNNPSRNQSAYQPYQTYGFAPYRDTFSHSGPSYGNGAGYGNGNGSGYGSGFGSGTGGCDANYIAVCDTDRGMTCMPNRYLNGSPIQSRLATYGWNNGGAYLPCGPGGYSGRYNTCANMQVQTVIAQVCNPQVIHSCGPSARCEVLSNTAAYNDGYGGNYGGGYGTPYDNGFDSGYYDTAPTYDGRRGRRGHRRNHPTVPQGNLTFGVCVLN